MCLIQCVYLRLQIQMVKIYKAPSYQVCFFSSYFPSNYAKYFLRNFAPNHLLSPYSYFTPRRRRKQQSNYL